jgi:hypothetical protein
MRWVQASDGRSSPVLRRIGVDIGLGGHYPEGGQSAVEKLVIQMYDGYGDSDGEVQC